MGNYSKYKYVNTAFGGTGGLVVPNGTTAQRDSGVAVGTLRYNTDLGLIEQYNALGWQSVDAPPTVTNISGTINENTNSTITITGSNFKTGAIVRVEGAAVSGIPRALSTTFVSTTQLTAATNAAAVNYVGAANFDISVGNPSGLGGTLSNAGTIDRDPVWSTAAGTYSVFDGSRGTPITFAAADPDGGTITYSVLSGSLPAGATLNTTTGVISGFSAVASDTSSPFTLRATSSVGSQTADRPFTILVRAPVVTTFTATGAATFNVPTGVTAVEVLVVAGGSVGGNQHGGGGGAGGLIFRPGFPVTPGGSVAVNVGAGGTGMPAAGSNGYWDEPQAQGKDSTFGTLTAKGGGIGPSHIGGPSAGLAGRAGGSGGGGNSDPAGGGAGGPGNQSAQPGDSGTYGFGNPGGSGQPGPGFPNWVGGGGGGAGGAGGPAPGPQAGNGGVGRAYSISGTSTFYAGGGGGGQHQSPDNSGGNGGNGGGGAGNRSGHNSTNNAHPGPRGQGGTANRGGGGGGSASGGVTTTDPGGSGIVIVKY
jgi:hypothetical protein